MIVLGGPQAELREDRSHVLLDCALRDDEPLADPLVRPAFRNQFEHRALPRCQYVEAIVSVAATRKEL